MAPSESRGDKRFGPDDTFGLQRYLESTAIEERDTAELLERLDRLAIQMYELARDWEDVDPHQAMRIRKEEQRIHELRGRIEHLGELEAAEASSLVSQIRAELRRALAE